MRRLYLAMAIVGCGALSLYAQGFATVQLPSFRRFSINTTVSVPDRGGIQIGGVGRSWQRSTRRGTPFLPGGTRTSASGTGSTGVSVHAHIHDLTELDAAVLREWQAKKPARRAGTSLQADLGQASAQVDVAHKTSRRPLTIRQRRDRVAAQEQKQQAQAATDYQAGLRLEQQGKTGAAKIYYGMALKRARGELRQKTVARLARLSGTRFVQR